MTKKFVGGLIYSNFNRATRSLTGYLREIKEPIDLEVTLVDSWQVENGTNSVWLLPLGSSGDVYVYSLRRTGSGEDEVSSDKGGLFSGPGWNLDFDCLNQDEPLWDRILCFIKKAWKLILVIVGLLLLLRKRNKK